MIEEDINENKKLWIVGQVVKNSRIDWEFAGIFSTKEKAIEACLDLTYFIGPCVLDQKIPEESVEWPNCYYPHLNSEIAK